MRPKRQHSLANSPKNAAEGPHYREWKRIMQQDVTVNAIELGEWLGLSDRQVRHLAERKIIERPTRGRYQLQASVQATVAHLREMAAGRASEDDSLDLVAERARLAKEQADAQAMRNDQRRNELVEVADVAKLVGQQYARVRTRLLAIPSGHAAQIARLKTPQEVQPALQALLTAALEELSADEEGPSE